MYKNYRNKYAQMAASLSKYVRSKPTMVQYASAQGRKMRQQEKA